ncbi:MAG: cytosine permease [Clostridiales bacterium]|nr:cytosine permease [Clostridiales bacterium]
MEMENKKIQKVDIDYTNEAVPQTARKGFGAMFVIMLGFTFFSASMWTGVDLANGLDLKGFIWAILIGGVILALYTGALGYIGCDSGLSFDLLARRAFGDKGSYLPSAMISLTQIGWFGVGAAMFAIPAAEVLNKNSAILPYILVLAVGVCMTASAYFGIKGLEIVSYISVPLIAILGTYAMVTATVQGGGLNAIFNKSTGGMTLFAAVGLVIGSFVSGGTATPNFVRFAKNNKIAVITTVIAFFLGNTLMFCFGGVAGAFTGSNDIFWVMIELGMGVWAFLVLGANIWTTNDNALYTGALGLANITGQKKKPMVILSGIIGTVAAMWLYNNFCNWLTILNATLPAVGVILVADYFLDRKKYAADVAEPKGINWAAIIGVVAGAVVGNLTGGNIIPGFTWGIAAINNMVVSFACYFIGRLITNKKQ